MSQSKAVVLLSGGQDSATVFFQALLDYKVMGAVSFDYGQRHKIELQLAAQIAANSGVPHAVLPVPVLKQLAMSSLTNDEIANDVSHENEYAAARGLPASFTPGRNLLFFTMGAAVAAKLDATVLVTGVCQQDSSGYPDCRAEFVGIMQEAIRLGFDWPQFCIVAPLLNATKADTWRMADNLGVLDVIVNRTNSCYEGDRNNWHPWGWGCGECGACVERRKGFEEFVLDKQTATV